MKNYIVDLNNKEKFIDLNNAIAKNTMVDNEGYYKVFEYYLCFINNKPCAVYKNRKGYTHIILLEKSRVQSDYLLKYNDIKFQNTFFSTPKEIIDKAINKDLFLNKSEIATIQV